MTSPPPRRAGRRRGASFALLGGALLALALFASAIPRNAFADARLEERIAEAIHRGRDALLPQLRRLVSEPLRDHPMGNIALPLAAVIKAGAPPEHPVVTVAFDKLAEMEITQTYDASCYLFALDARWRATYRESLGGSGRTGVNVGPRAQGKALDEIRRAVDWLVEARAEGRGHWSYGAQPPGSGTHDYSNTQFAILGLQIGLEHGVRIPRLVFVEIANSFLRSQRVEATPRRIRVRYEETLAERLAEPASSGRTGVEEASPKDRSTTVPPGGWDYVASQRNPYASMTAAGASSLLVARNGLGSGSADLVRQIERALYQSYAWIGKYFDLYISPGRHDDYTLYSLEKVGDLAGIQLFDDHDWYEEGARELLRRQHQGGDWGSHVDTSFALLFLTRATRLKTVNPVVFTRADGDEESAHGDLVYLGRLGGFVSAREVLLLIAAERKPELLDVAREIIHNCPPRSRSLLVGPLFRMWTDREDAVSRFARTALRDVTGVRSSRREDFEAWIRESARVEALATGELPSIDDVRRLLAETTTAPLRDRIVEILHVRGLKQFAGLLIEELERTEDANSRQRLHDYLRLWTAANVSGPEGPGREAGERLAARWREWWDRGSGNYLATLEARRLVAELESLTSDGLARRGGELDAERVELVDRIVAVGPPAVAVIRDAMRRREFSVHLLWALEKITGSPPGLGDL